MGIGNDFTQSAGFGYALLYILGFTILGILLIVFGISKLNESGWINVEANIINTQDCKENSKMYTVEFSYNNNLIQKSICTEETTANVLNLQYHPKINSIRTPEMKNIGTVLIVLGAISLCMALLFVFCARNKSCRMGLGIFGFISLMLD
jgi:hypothetical protein